MLTLLLILACVILFAVALCLVTSFIEHPAGLTDTPANVLSKFTFRDKYGYTWVVTAHNVKEATDLLISDCDVNTNYVYKHVFLTDVTPSVL